MPLSASLAVKLHLPKYFLRNCQKKNARGLRELFLRQPKQSDIEPTQIAKCLGVNRVEETHSLNWLVVACETQAYIYNHIPTNNIRLDRYLSTPLFRDPTRVSILLCSPLGLHHGLAESLDRTNDQTHLQGISNRRAHPLISQ